MNAVLRLLFTGAVSLLISSFAGCGKKSESTGAAAKDAGPALMEQDLAKTIKEQADFYAFKTPADVPASLKWENGSDLPEFADLNAKKGGSFSYWIADFPRTLRTIGPDATG